MAAADEANPQSHPDALRRRRTLRDAGLAAKANANFPLGADSAAAAAAPDGAVPADGSGGGVAEDGEAPWIGRRVLGVGKRAQVVRRDYSTARLSLGSRYVGGRRTQTSPRCIYIHDVYFEV